ncbi:DNA-directed RNA polymerase II subunit RPB1 [Operophtera brumata]|uniref:DNA-directed RNA polymerase II subunit RPB1 n=1 Tax=Operophtera brumata TaxID=104452 RepID=A0A0L7KWS5_OPEBR|nr:DNA-directed RNA polymerase II subunit RPB1 [Operophtera brumata]
MVVEPNPLCEGKRTQVPSPSFCNNFLNCWDGWAVEQECPIGLLFSNKGYCDYADTVNCHNRKVNGEVFVF